MRPSGQRRVSRRAVLAGAAVAGLGAVGGCLSEPDAVTDQQFEVLERGCTEGDRTNAGTISIGEDGTVTVGGVFVPDEPCVRPRLVPYLSGSEHHVILDVADQGPTDCVECRQFYRYEGRVTFRAGPPAKVKLIHTAGLTEGESVAVRWADGSPSTSTPDDASR